MDDRMKEEAGDEEAGGEAEDAAEKLRRDENRA
jgi:hypothetical protein